MANVYIEARPKGRAEGAHIDDYVVEDHAADHVLGTFKTQREAIDWARGRVMPRLFLITDLSRIKLVGDNTRKKRRRAELAELEVRLDRRRAGQRRRLLAP